MKNLLSFVVVFLMIIGISRGQGKLIAEDTAKKEPTKRFVYQEQLVNDAKYWLKQSSSNNDETVMNDFANVWDRLLDDRHRALCFHIAARMYEKNYELNPIVEDFFASVAYAKKTANISNTTLNRYLEVVDSSVILYPERITGRFFHSARLLFEENAMYKRGPEVIVFKSGDITFGHSLDVEMMLPDADAELAGSPSRGVWFGSSEESDAPEEETVPDEDPFAGFDEPEAPEWDDPEEPIIEISPAKPNTPKSIGPVIRFSNATITIGSPRDSLTISQVQGDFQIKDYNFVGQAGKITWNAGGIPKEKVKVDFEGGFTTQTDKLTLKAQNAKLTYQDKLSRPVVGEYLYENKATNNTTKADFPQFISYDNDISVNNYAEDVDFRGGFSLFGGRVSSKSLGVGYSEITVKKDEAVKFRARSQREFIMQDSVIINPQTEIVIYQGENDSIQHPAVDLKYDPRSRYLHATRDKEGYRHAPFVNTFHDVEVSGEELKWHLETDSIDVNIVQSRNRSLLHVESRDFFSDYKFTKLQGLYPFHPIQLAVSYGRQINSKTFTVAELAKRRNLPYHQVKEAMLWMERKGILDYDELTDKITLERKALIYYAAKNQLSGIDYDNIRFNSLITSGANSTFKFDSGQYLIRGVNYFLISDSMRVLVTPIDKTAIVEKNRDTKFSGKMEAGKLIFRGSNFVFDYDSFKVDMPQIDSIAFVVQDSTGEFQEMDNNIVGSKGLLYISKPNNKSGLTPLPNYPRFIAPEGGKITFDGNEILEGAYDERVYFDIPFMDIDSVNSSDPTSFDLEGNFYSSGMFPDFENQRVSIMPDNSFGFVKETPAEGYPIFNGVGQFLGDINLDNNGIRGKGNIQYLAGNFESEDFVYYSDSVKTYGNEGKINGGTFAATLASYPAVSMDKYKMRWLVNNDSMLLSTYKGDRFRLYEDPRDPIRFEGTLSLTPKKLGGTGILENNRTIIKSDEYNLKEVDFVARNAEYFKIKSKDPDKEAVLGENVSVDYSLAKRKAEIYTEEGQDGSFSFPYTEYKTTLTEATWDFDKQEVVMSANEEKGVESATFTSLNKSQIGLSFEATDATYDLRDFKLTVDGIPEIIVAGNSIVPDSNRVVIREGADMDALTNATVTLNSETRYHHFYDANIEIISKDNFEGGAKYEFRNEMGQTYEFDCTFKVERLITEEQQKKYKQTGTYGDHTLRTTATAFIRQEDEVNIKPGTRFYGDIRMRDNKKFFEYDGFYAADDGREVLNWQPYIVTDTSEAAIVIDGSSLTNATGLFIDQFNDRQLFATFSKDLGGEEPIKVFTALGEMSYDDNTSRFVVAPKEKITNPYTKGQILTYHKTKKDIDFDGIFKFLESKNEKAFNIYSAGTGKGNTEEGEFSFNSLFLLEFESAQPMDMIAEDLIDPASTKANPDFKKLKSKLVNLMTPKDYEDFIKTSQQARINFADFLSKYFAITDVNMKWSDVEKAFYSEPEVGVSNIFKTNIDARVEAYIEIPKINNNSTIFIYIKGKNSWYYFEYEKGSDIKVYSGSAKFRAAMNSKKMKGKSNLKLLNDPDKAIMFVNFYRTTYLGLDEIDLPIEEDTEIIEEEVYSDDDMETIDEEETFPEEEEKSEKKDKKKKAKKDKKDDSEEETEEEDGDGGW